MSGDYGINETNFLPSYPEMIRGILPDSKTALKGVVALAFVAIAAAAIYNRGAIKDFVMGKFNHITSGAQAGDAPAVSVKPMSLSQDANGTWGWQAQS